MFERFAAFHGVPPAPDDGTGGKQPRTLFGRAKGAGPAGWEAFQRAYAGRSFGGGVYRTVAAPEVDRWTRVVGALFTDYAGRITVFGYDWLGRMFALDAKRTRRGEALVLLLEPGSGEALEIPSTFAEFHDEQMPGNPDAVLASAAFAEWRAGSGHDLAHDRCVGYVRPLFLGGVDGPENFEETDLAVYWDVTTQIVEKVRNLPPGTPIGSIGIE